MYFSIALYDNYVMIHTHAYIRMYVHMIIDIHNNYDALSVTLTVEYSVTVLSLIVH